YSWSPSTGLSSSTVSNPTASPSSTTNYTVTLTKGGCTATDQVLVTVKALPEINITGNTTICRGGETTIGTSSVPNIAYQWAPTTGVEDPNKATSIVRPVANTKYKLIQTNLNTGCTSFKEVQVIVNEPNFSIDASAPAPLEVCQGTAITLPLELTPSNTNCVFFWAPTPGLNNAFVQNPVATPMTNTTYRLEVTNLDNNCILTAYVPVTVVPLELCTGNEFGDVPVALEKSSAGYHKRTTKLKIGLNTDSELGPQSVYPGSISDGDDTNGDDEDGLGTLPNLHPSTTSFETVVSSVMNTEYASAYMAGWIDFNRDNCFDDNERTPVQYIPKDTLGAPPVELVWSGFNPSGELPFGKIYMRLRLTADDRDGWAQQPSANGYRRSGEVEDYCMRVYQSNAYPDSKVANTGDNAVGDLSTNDDMPPGTKYLSPTVMGTNPSAAMPVVDMNGTFTFSATVPGVYNYLVPVFDGVVTEQIKLTITVLNPAVVSNPVLGTDNAITVVNTPVMLNTLANDFAGGLLSQLNPSSVTITVAPLHGVAVVDTATGKIMYTPNAGYVGSDTYTYSVGDDSSPVRTATGCQFIQVIPENCENTVFASNDQVCAIAGFKNRGNVLDNDMDAEGDQIYAVPMTVTTADYTFMLNADGSYMLQTSNDYTDPIVINYAINDDQFYPQGRDTAMLCFYLKSAIGNLVWDDKDRDGVQDSLEMGVANATVTMHTCSNGTPGAALPDYTVTTDEFGVYAFPVPAVGSYALRFDYSSILNGSKYKFSIPNIEFNGIDTLDSDANMTTGFTGCFEVVNSSSVTHLDAGIFLDADGDYQPDCFDSDTLIIDPLGYFYCENTGEILNGGSISVTGPGNIYMIFDGTSGFYQFLVDASGLYTIAVTNPGGYVSSEDCVVEDDTLDAGGITLVVGSDDADGDDFLDDYTCPANTFYYHMLLSPGDYIVNNNFPMSCLDLGDLPTGYPTLVANDGPSHAILQHPLVFLGDTVDVEGNGQPDIMAGMMSGGDDAPTATSPDDEDGIAVLPALVITQDAPVIVKVNNLSAKDAKLVGFLDLNADFDFDDAGEMQSSNVQAGYSGNDTLTFSVPVDAAVGSKVGLRLRLSTECENSVPPPPPGPVPVTSFDGSIDLTDPKFSRPFSPGNNSLACNENAPPGNNYYDLYEFTVSANGTYVFDASGAPGDTYAILSETPFDPLQPCAKFIKTGNNESDQDPVITANLVAGVNYVLLFTPNAANNAIGSYSIALSGDGDVLVEDNNQPQACSYNFLLEDEYGDGWNNASMKIYKGSVLVATLGGTFNGGYSQEVNVPLDPNTSYSLFYMGGGDYPDEVGITVYDESGNEVLFLDYGAGTVGDTLFTWNTGVCIPSTPPIMTPTGTICNGEIEDYMLVIAGFDYGDLPDSYNTTGSDNPPAHIVSEDLKLGSSVDSELDGTPDPMAGLMGGGDDGDPGLVTFGTSTPAGDDENGVMLATPMVPGSDAAFMVDAMNMTGSDAVLQAWIDFDGSGTFEPGEELTTGDFAPDGANVPVGGLSGAKLY
ncbi:MAG: GEVED domain-containing protein, partial [Bacteroidota bacterium]